MRDINLGGSLPASLGGLKEFKVLHEAEETALSGLLGAADGLLSDQFAKLMSEAATRRFEDMLGIRPGAAETLDERRFRVISRLSESVPYTMNSLHRRLAALLGGAEFEMRLRAEEYMLDVNVRSASQAVLSEVARIVRASVPANMAARVDYFKIMHGALRGRTHGRLGGYTHSMLKYEVIQDG